MKDIQMSISALRVNACMTQQDVADKLGVSRSLVIKWENGEGVKDLVIYALAKLYGVEIDNIRIPA